ncbi:insulinase family protein [Clostridium sp. JN-1]|uniref:insulinase family protein n=1 Tax=Clostridium sp. JN-1 TaxID=2483110 RepID=UPI000F0B77F0|nr:insulinase family protein [Clostridium sp. JN-1]
MELQLGKEYSGFEFLERKHISEINSNGMIFEHKKSGARLFYLENDDDNKVFAISFRTPPEDSRGTPHILEHSVLCGSRKFPVKEPFVELVKGSLNTFLNAFTFPDKTMYPVASTNDKDFSNLMDVYLDAVFYPNIYNTPEIMMQEGWHYELEDKNAPISYKGVVYNEMKGAFSAPESILFRKISESLFPDTQYGLESGGDPYVIPTLTQEQFTNFHKKYYHPSNSYIYLYGKMDILDRLNFLNENYLKNFDRQDIDSKINLQVPFDHQKQVNIKYPILANEKEEDKTFLSMNFVTGKATDPEAYLAFDILELILLEMPSSPLKRAIIDAKIGKDVFGGFESSMLQTIFTIVVKNSNKDRVEEFKQVVMDSLKKLVKDGIDKKLIEAAINIREFGLREANYQGYPKGLVYGMKCMDSWLYDEKPWIHLTYETALSKIKAALTTPYFENLIEKHILNNEHSSVLIVEPEKGLLEKKENETKEELQKFKDSLSEGQIDELIKNTQNLKKRQGTPDLSENLEKIPLISINDIDPKAKKLQLIEDEECGVKVLYHPVFTNKIAYVNLYFDTSAVRQELIPYISLLSTILGKINTENYKYEDLSKNVDIYTGGIRYFVEAFSKNGSTNEFYPKFIVKSKVLVENLSKLVELIEEIIKKSKFDDCNRIKEIIDETKSRMEMIIFDRGHIVTSSHLLSYFSSVGKYQDIVSGLGFYKFIADLDKNFDQKSKEISENLNEAARNIFNKNNLITGITLDEENYAKHKQCLNQLYNDLDSSKVVPQKYELKLTPENEGLMTSGKVQYVSKAYNFIELGYKYSGSLQVLKVIANYTYLWTKVRVQGGAYGCFSSFQRNGNMFFTSYRDPNLKDTLKVYDEAGEFIKNFDAGEREMRKYIIGAISDLDYPLNPSMQGEAAAENYIKGTKYEDRQKEREDVLNTDVKQIREYGNLIEDAMKKNCICVLGNEDKIKQEKDLFNQLANVFD